MKQLMLTHAFRFVERVVFRVGPHNLRSQKAMERIGQQPSNPATSNPLRGGHAA